MKGPAARPAFSFMCVSFLARPMDGCALVIVLLVAIGAFDHGAERVVKLRAARETSLLGTELAVSSASWPRRRAVRRLSRHRHPQPPSRSCRLHRRSSTRRSRHRSRSTTRRPSRIRPLRQPQPRLAGTTAATSATTASRRKPAFSVRLGEPGRRQALLVDRGHRARARGGVLPQVLGRARLAAPDRCARRSG